MEKFTELGITENYCLGLLNEKEAAELTIKAAQNDEIRLLIEETEKTLLDYKKTNPRESMKGEILKAISSIPYLHKIDIAKPPFIDRNSDVAEWNEAITHIRPNTDHGHIKTAFITFSPGFQLCVAWLYDKLEEAGHQEDEFQESFLILEGTCECSIGGKIFRLQAGDYLDIPSGAKHTIVSTSQQGFVKALIQRRKPAA